VEHNLFVLTANQLYKAPYLFLLAVLLLLYQQYAGVVNASHAVLSVTKCIAVPSLYLVVYKFFAIQTYVPMVKVL
jgi:hypothetical protein